MRRSTLAALGLLATAAPGCDFPTSPPLIEQRWVLPVENSSIGVDELLPPEVTSRDGAFDVALDPTSIDRTLGSLCAACVPLDGTQAVKPAFDEVVEVSTALPTDVVSADLEGGVVELVMTNGFGFDPLRPGGSGTGTLTIEVRAGAGGALLGSLIVSGATTSLGAGQTLTRSVTLGSGTVTSELVTTVQVTSPAGSIATIDTGQRFTVRATPRDVRVAAASVRVDQEDVTIDPVDVDTGGLDDEVVDRIVSGGIVLEVTNPFGITVTGQLDIVSPAGVISRPLDIASGSTSTVSLTYSRDELRTFLGESDVTIRGAATVGAPGPVMVRPGDAVGIDATIDLVIQIGG